MLMYKSYKKDVLKALEQAEQQALTLIGEHGQSEVIKKITSNKSVKTSLMRNSTLYEVQKDRVTIGNSVFYAPYVELGTSRQRAKPFLKPAIYGATARFKNITEAVFKEVFR
jgi:HK97 gp10 family phage protein